MRSVLRAFTRNRVFANILLVLFFLAGGMATRSMVREAFPEFSLEAIEITVVYPGADPEEVEEGVCRKIEEAIEGVQGIKQYNTTSAEGVGMAFLEVDEDYETADVLDQVRSKIDAISTFPPDAEQPIVAEFLLRDVVMMVALSGDATERGLKEWAADTKDALQQLPSLSQLEIAGARDYEISIEVSEPRLREYGLTLSDVARAVRGSSLNLAGGTIRTQGEEIRVRTIGRKYTGEEFSDIIVLAKPDGQVVTLDRIADIRDDFTEEPLYLSLNGRRAVSLLIYKTREQDSLQISKDVNAFIADLEARSPEGVEMSVLYDVAATMLRARIDLLVRNGVIGLSLVFLLLWTFLDVRLSFWAGMGMPISVAGALAILWAVGGTINMISLFGLIMVLGIIVDDAIVVGEAIYVHRSMGKPPLQAAVDGVCEVGLPVIAAILTTIVAFIPLMYVGGIMGKFIRILPVVVIACLVISLIECLILLPAHLGDLPDPNRERKKRGGVRGFFDRFHQRTSRALESFIEHRYSAFLRKSISRSYIVMAVGVAVMMLIAGVVMGGLLKFQVFPKLDGFVVTSTVEFANGTPPAVTRDAVEKIEATFHDMTAGIETRSGKPLINDIIASVGTTLEDYPRIGGHLGSVQVVLLDSAERGIHSDELMVRWKDAIGDIPGVESLTFAGLATGPPGAPIEVWLQGRNMANILSAADALKAKLGTFDGVYQIQSDFRPGKNEIQLQLKPEARALGLTVEDLARQIYAGYFGEEALRLQRGRDDIRVRVRYPEADRRQLADLYQIRIRTAQGHEVPLISVADLSFGPGYSAITRTDGMRRVSVSAEVDGSKANAGEIFKELAGYFDELRDSHPGLYVSLQGEQKKMRESLGSLKVGYPLALIGIFIIIATIFRSYTQPFIIMCVIPFGMIGAVVAHMLMGYNMSMMSMFGMVALAGVVVNDAIVMIEAMNDQLAAGVPFEEALVNGGKRRFRAVFLTSLSTVGGLMPLILEQDMQARVLIPMALAIAGGVTFSTIVTLVMIPSLMHILNDLRLVVHRVRRGVWPTREEVEPSTRRGQEEAV